LEAYLQRTRERIDKAGDVFCVCFDGLGTSADLMADASEQLARVAVREHMASTQMEIQRQVAEDANHQLESKNHELQERATRDALTGLYNRTFFAEALEAAIDASSRSATPIGVVFSDIDSFKKLNDTYGHPFGDEVLRSVSRNLQETLRKSDIVARYGGEEFVVLVHHPTEKGLEKLSERLRQSIESAAFWFDGKRVPITISIGAAIVLPERDAGDLALRLVAAADEAMYEANRMAAISAASVRSSKRTTDSWRNWSPRNGSAAGSYRTRCSISRRCRGPCWIRLRSGCGLVPWRNCSDFSRRRKLKRSAARSKSRGLGSVAAASPWAI